MSISQNFAILHDAIERKLPEPQRAEAEKYLRSVMMRDSGGNANAKNPNSSACGLFQFIDSTWKTYGDGCSKFDPKAQCEAAIDFMKDNDAKLRDLLCVTEPTASDRYLAHFLGAGGAVKVLSAEDNAPIKGLVSSGVIAANSGMRAFHGKKFADFTVGDLREWAGVKMDMSTSELYSLRRQDESWTPSPEEDEEEHKRRKRFADGFELSAFDRALLNVLGLFLMAVFGGDMKQFGQDTSEMPLGHDGEPQASAPQHRLPVDDTQHTMGTPAPLQQLTSRTAGIGLVPA